MSDPDRDLTLKLGQGNISLAPYISFDPGVVVDPEGFMSYPDPDLTLKSRQRGKK